MRLLVIEDSVRLRDSLVDGLSRCGYAVDSAADGLTGLDLAGGSSYDLIILDLMLPGMDGLSLLRTLRKRGSLTHVLILSARDRVEHRVEGLQAGADDYLVKPFDFAELRARVEVLGRRAHGRKSSLLEFPPLTIDLTSRKARIDDEVIDL
jgi:two-component system copper resistance phosphate regulon response regulator CusR